MAILLCGLGILALVVIAGLTNYVTPAHTEPEPEIVIPDSPPEPDKLYYLYTYHPSGEAVHGPYINNMHDAIMEGERLKQSPLENCSGFRIVLDNQTLYSLNS